MPTDIALSKPPLRQECRRLRDSIAPSTRHQANTAICQVIQNWEVFKNSTTICTYLSMNSEVDLSSLLTLHPNKTWAIPRILPAGRMVFHAYDPARLTRHPYGMLEPEPDCPVVSPNQVQLALVPGLAFDQLGWRLGYGGGFYDRFLFLYRGVSAGISYQALYLNQIPHAQHDIPMQFVITETGIKTTHS